MEVFVTVHQSFSYHVQGDMWEPEKGIAAAAAHTAREGKLGVTCAETWLLPSPVLTYVLCQTARSNLSWKCRNAVRREEGRRPPGRDGT